MKGPDRHRIPIPFLNLGTKEAIDELLADWGDRIRNAREAKGMSQAELDISDLRPGLQSKRNRAGH